MNSSTTPQGTGFPVNNARRAGVLLVSHNAQNVALLEQSLRNEGYGVVVATTAAQFQQTLDEGPRASLALVDLTGFDAGIWPQCERLRAASVPLLMLAARKSPVLDATGRAHGANSVLVKPVGVRELVSLIKLMIEE